jgi:uncharacterized OB-fold protein
MGKPLPRSDAVTRHFWLSCKDGRFEFQCCQECGHKQFPPRQACAECHGLDLSWQQSAGHGSVYSFTVAHRAPLEAFKPDVPYVVAIVELDEGVRAMMNLRGVDPDAVEIGMPVDICFEANEGEYPLPQARPRPVFTFERFEPGKWLGSRTLVLDDGLVEQWLALFPEDRNGRTMPPGMMAAVFSRAYSSILQPRPPGNVHGEQDFTISRLPEIGDTLNTDLRCASKEAKGERLWVRFASETRNQQGELMFSSVMTTLWAK